MILISVGTGQPNYTKQGFHNAGKLEPLFEELGNGLMVTLYNGISDKVTDRVGEKVGEKVGENLPVNQKLIVELIVTAT